MIYFDNAATSRFKPKEVIKAVEYEMKHAANPGRSGHDASIMAAQRISDTRDSIIEYFNAPHHNVVFTKNCTEALNLAFNVLSHGHVIITANEHNSVLRPLFKLADENLITVSVVSPAPDGYINPLEIERKIQKNTAMIVINHVSNVTGIETDLFNIGKIADKHGIVFTVDAAQSAGHVNIDVEKLKIDMLAAPAHKGLYGIQGCGFLIFNDRLTVPPLILGGTGTMSDSLIQPLTPPEAQEAGTLNTPSIIGLKAGIDWVKKHFTEIKTIEKKLTEELIYGLKNIKKIKLYSSPESKGVVSFNVKGIDSSSVADALNERGIAVRSGLHCAPLIHRYLNSGGAVRVSFGYNNTVKQVHKLLRTIEKLL